MNLLITGGAGFIGSNFIQYILNKYPEYKLFNVDQLTYAGNLMNLVDYNNHSNYQFIKCDIRDEQKLRKIIYDNKIDAILNFAAESHVDRSIATPSIFVETNVLGTQILLDLAKELSIKKYVQISTDEVYGSLGDTGLFTEDTPLAPNSPYSASKAGADMLVRAYHETFNLNVNITRCSNNYGPYQFPEKLIPLMITRALEKKSLPLYGDGKNVRDWLHVYDHCSAIDLVLHKGTSGEVYNIGGNNERKNIEIVELILEYIGENKELIEYVEDRLGHDRRYAIDSSKIQQELGWKPVYTFEVGIKGTIDWYLNNKSWLNSIESKEYLLYNKQYGDN
ncbi:dTDP-glucose 4,6-dehydratase [Metabacillus fastidiosus]|uniref:dTDP-glucose 4,6-dehydratase n=1 Tax=Metabacillus fastidiosus TaxID=1458 RepID=UPI003D2CEBC8